MQIVQEPWSSSSEARLDIGLVVFEDDNVSEPTLNRLLGPAGIDVHTTRMPLPAAGSHADDLATALRLAAATILPSAPPAVIAFACTTGAAQMGIDRLRHAIQRPDHDIAVVSPFDALIAALSALGAKRVAMISPYSKGTSEALGNYLQRAGYVLSHLGYFDADNPRIPEISPGSIVDAARRSVRDGSSEVLFLSCTGMRSTPLIETLETELDLPVLTSLQVMAAQIATIMGVRLSGPGRLFGVSHRVAAE